jgi:hypothetical protein
MATNFFPVTASTTAFFDGGNQVIRGSQNRVDGEIVVAPSGSNGAVITTRGFTNSHGIFQSGSTAIFIGTGVAGNANTPFLVGSGSNGPIFSLGDRLIAEQTGSEFTVTVSGTLLVQSGSGGPFVDVRTLIGQASGLSALYAIETATNALNSASLNLALSSSLFTASLQSASASLAQKEVADSASLASQTISISASLSSQAISFSASLSAQNISFSSSQAQYTETRSVVDLVNKIKLPASVKTISGLYLETSSIGFYNATQSNFPVVINDGGQFRFADTSSFVGGSDPYDRVIGFANGAFLVRTSKLFLSTPGLQIIGSDTSASAANSIRLGASAANISFNNNLGFYADGTGSFRIGTDSSGSEYIQFSPSVGLITKAKRLVLDAGGIYATSDSSSAPTGHSFRVGPNAAGMTLTSVSGAYIDGAGNFRVGDPLGNFLEFTPANALRIVTTKVVMDGGGVYLLSHPASGSTNVFKLGANASNITFASGSGFYVDGDGNFRIGKTTGSGDYVQFSANNSLFISSSNLWLQVGTAPVLQLNNYQFVLGSKIPSAWPFPVNDTGFSGSYINKDGQIFFGKANGNYIQFGGQVIELKSSAFVLDAPGIWLQSGSTSQTSGSFAVGTSPSTMNLTTGTGVFLGGTGTFRAGNPAANQVIWDGSTLSITGSINISGGNGATQTYAISTATNAQTSASNADATVSSSAAAANPVNPIGGIKTTSAPTGQGLFLGSKEMGYYSGSTWQTYISGSGVFQFKGDASNIISWDGSSLTITGSLRASGKDFFLSGSGIQIDSVTKTIRMGLASALTTGPGVYLDGTNGTARFGDPAGDYIKWDATNLVVAGGLSGSNLFLGNGKYRQGTTTTATTTAGAGATTIYSFQFGDGAYVFVYGGAVGTTTQYFVDLVGAVPNVAVGATQLVTAGASATRTYSVATGNTLKLTMSSGSYTIKVVPVEMAT